MSRILSDRELLGRLVAFDSTSRNSNRPIADFICDYLDRPGVRIERHDDPDEPKVNLVIRIGPAPEEDRGGLVLSGHLDVVPAEEPEWESDPFQLRERDGRLVGRGACDMKGFVALAVNAAAATRPPNLKRPLVLIFTYDEELGTLGAQRLAETYSDPESLPRSAIVGEPTSLRVVRMHKGHLFVRITLRGSVAHSGYPHLGRSAIEPAAEVINALARLRRDLERESAPNTEFFPEVPYVALNVGVVSGGRAVNVIPDVCTMDVGARVLPGMEASTVLRRIREAAREATAAIDPELEVVCDSPPLLLEEGSAVNRFLSEEVGQSETLSVSYATDAGWLQKMGMECAIYGPGSIEVAHKPNEYLPLEELRGAGTTVERCIHRFCV